LKNLQNTDIIIIYEKEIFMKQIDRVFFTDMIERIINAYKCGEDKLPGDRCKYCPYGYGYLDDSGDHAFWWCNDDALVKDAITLLYILKEKI
jgi:hypothetical protein